MDAVLLYTDIEYNKQLINNVNRETQTIFCRTLTTVIGWRAFETEMRMTTFGVVTTLLLHTKQHYIVPHTPVIVVVYPQLCTNTHFYHCTPSHFHNNSSSVSINTTQPVENRNRCIRTENAVQLRSFIKIDNYSDWVKQKMTTIINRHTLVAWSSCLLSSWIALPCWRLV